MLDQYDSRTLIEETWSTVGCKVELPEDLKEFFAKDGPLPIEYSDRRSHRRLYFRSRGVLIQNEDHCCVYTKDISRGGLVFFHDRQLFPQEEVQIVLLTGKPLRARITRCRRVQQNCYECGATFLSS